MTTTDTTERQPNGGALRRALIAEGYRQGVPFWMKHEDEQIVLEAAALVSCVCGGDMFPIIYGKNRPRRYKVMLRCRSCVAADML